jgi:ectoine hydroxylase-related dioxygenase (phytanoyl-CoA dioxygenase family)
LVAVQWALVDHNPGRGGFLCVPGSHKANFPRPAEVAAGMAVEVPMKAGDVVIFTEALTHGTSTWQGPRQRRTLLYKYSPGNSAWSHEVWPAELLNSCTSRQRLLLQPPSVGNHRPLQ